VPVSLSSARPSQSVRPVPAYRDAAIKALSERLEHARMRRNSLQGAGRATDALDSEILDLRRQLREGGQLLAGDTLGDGRYLLLESAGRGGFAVVWDAHDTRSDQHVAIKVLHAHLAGDPLRRDRFFRGARAMTRLTLPTVVQVLEPEGEDGGFHYFVMEFVPGGNLSEAVRDGRLETKHRLPLLLRVCETVAEVHAKGMIHRDIKPSNILLDQDSQPKLTDFDLVGARDTTGGTRTGAAGTLLYAAPECLTRPQDATACADVYGLGMTAIIVVHKSDSAVPQRQIDEAGLRRTYPAIVGFARTSCNAGAAAAASIAGLRALIAATLSDSPRLQHVHDPIPQSWLRVKDAITELAASRSVLPVHEFERLCEGNATARAADRITDPGEQRAVLALLRDLGVVVVHGLHHQTAVMWRDIAVLDPNWPSGAIYALISSATARDQAGELRHDQIGALLDPGRYPPRWHELILGMMQEPELGLCLLITHDGPPRYLLPDALPVHEPDYGVWPADALRFRFQYNLLPTGIIPRFIVETNRHVTEKPTWWRTGVVLRVEGCRILVRGHIALNRVEIHVAGATGRRAALAVVRNYFKAVHRYYAKLSVKERVPLPDQPDVDVGYDHLVNLEREEGIDHIFLPEDAHRKYSVRELLEGVRIDGT
jgi:hypothetical protein